MIDQQGDCLDLASLFRNLKNFFKFYNNTKPETLSKNNELLVKAGNVPPACIDFEHLQSCSDAGNLLDYDPDLRLRRAPVSEVVPRTVPCIVP